MDGVAALKEGSFFIFSLGFAEVLPSSFFIDFCFLNIVAVQEALECKCVSLEQQRAAVGKVDAFLQISEQLTA
jgi:hypothetical protein